MCKLGNMSLSSEVLLVYCQLPDMNCVIARWEKSSALFPLKYRDFCQVGHSSLTGLFLHHSIFCIDSFRNESVLVYTCPSTVLKFFPEIWSSNVRKCWWFDISKTWKKKWSIRNEAINFWTPAFSDIALWSNNKVRLLVKTSFLNWDKHGKDILGGKEECLRKMNRWMLPECSSISK